MCYTRYYIIIWYPLAIATLSSGYNAPYVDIKGLPEMSYFQPGDINVAYVYGLSGQGINEDLCGKIQSNAYQTSEAAR